MGLSNVCVLGKYEGQYYIDNDFIHVYRRDDPEAEELEVRLMGELDYDELTGREWIYDDEGTGNEEDDILTCFMENFTGLFPSFKRVGDNKWLEDSLRDRRILLESGLFYICVVDNQWSLAIQLIQKEEPWGDVWMENLQKRLYNKYLDGMKTALLMRLPSIGAGNGGYTHRTIKREEVPVV